MNTLPVSYNAEFMFILHRYIFLFLIVDTFRYENEIYQASRIQVSCVSSHGNCIILCWISMLLGREKVAVEEMYPATKQFEAIENSSLNINSIKKLHTKLVNKKEYCCGFTW